MSTKAWSTKSSTGSVGANQVEIKDSPALLEEFKLVLALEEKMAGTYRQLADDCDDFEARQMLLELSRQEQGHARIARRLVRMVERWLKKGGSFTDRCSPHQ